MAKEQMDERDLLDLKKKIETAKTTVSELKGHQQALMTQLKNDFGCKTIEDAEKKLRTMKENIDSLEEQIESGTKDLQKKYNL